MASELDGQKRVLGVWGPTAYGWSGEERPRVLGFPIDPSGRQRVLGFPADSPKPLRRRRRRAHLSRQPARP